MEENDREYRRILVTRPNVQFDEDIGFLPGTEQEKIAPFLRPILDNLEVLLQRNKGEKSLDDLAKSKIHEVFENTICAEAMNFIRGR
ncbi:MAG TPA: ribonuclease, partial [Clostridium sp.]|nr:ribonuclease [Clostridium sp.]